MNRAGIFLRVGLMKFVRRHLGRHLNIFSEWGPMLLNHGMCRVYTTCHNVSTCSLLIQGLPKHTHCGRNADGQFTIYYRYYRIFLLFIHWFCEISAALRLIIGSGINENAFFFASKLVTRTVNLPGKAWVGFWLSPLHIQIPLRYQVKTAWDG